MRAAAGGLGLGLLCFFIYHVHIFFCECKYFFCAFLKHRQNKLRFSVSADFFRVCIVTHRKIIQLFCGFSYFSVGIF